MRRFLREFDVADRDPAKSAAALQKFEETMRTLFIQGWIMVDPAKEIATDSSTSKASALAASQGSAGDYASSNDSSAAGSRLGPAKTLTQVVLEQVEEMTEIRYGSRLRVLWNKTSKADCQASYKEIGQIVEDTLSRLHVDFHHRDLYMALEAMDVEAWQTASEAKLLVLRQKTRRLCDALGLRCSQESWQRVLRHVIGVRKKWLREAGRDVKTMDLRVLWDLAADTSPVEPATAEDLAKLDPLISFYIAIADGTGCVERGLGRHAAFLESHVGGPDNDMAEACLEIAVEGPGEEQQVFQKNGEVLLFTPVSRTWAQLWRVLHGRRFACYKENKNKGRHNTGLRLTGSLKAVAIQQARATGMLMRMARAAKSDEDQPTVVSDLSRKSLVRGACRIAGLPVGKKLQDFRKTTERRRAAKTLVPVWAGFGAAPVRFRRKTGTATSRMIATPHECKAQHPGLQARRWVRRTGTGGRQLGSTGSSSSSSKKRSATSALGSRDKKARVEDSVTAKPVSVNSLQELYSEKLEADAMRSWLQAIAYGRPAIEAKCKAGSEKKNGARHEAAVRTTSAKLRFSPRFIEKFPKLVKAFREAMASPNSKWREERSTASSSSSACTDLSSLHECQAFLQKMRQLPHIAGVHATYLDKPAVLSGPVSRYGLSKKGSTPPTRNIAGSTMGNWRPRAAGRPVAVV